MSKAVRHFDIEEWVDYVRRQVSPDQNGEMAIIFNPARDVTSSRISFPGLPQFAQEKRPTTFLNMWNAL